MRDAADDPVFEPEPRTAPLWPNVTLHALFAVDANLVPLRDLLAATFAEAAVDGRRTARVGVAAGTAANRAGTTHRRPPVARTRGRRARARRPHHRPHQHGARVRHRRSTRRRRCASIGSSGTSCRAARCSTTAAARASSRLAALVLGASASVCRRQRQPSADGNARQRRPERRRRPPVRRSCPRRCRAVSVDVLAANILAGPLVELAPTFATLVRPGGRLVLSGILEPQATHVAAAYAPYFAELRAGRARRLGAAHGRAEMRSTEPGTARIAASRVKRPPCCSRAAPNATRRSASPTRR